MKKYVYAIYDKVGQVYHNPWIDACDQTAARVFTLACSDKNSLYGMCPTDFALYRVAEFGDHSGVFCECENPVKVLDGREVDEGE